MTDRFIPGTKERKVSGKVVFRPIRSWHSNTYAGEKKETNGGDGSGCLKKVNFRGYESEMCSIPLSVTHRLYWHTDNPSETISAFLSYPNGMGCSDEYFWEAYELNGDCERFFGGSAEEDMEKIIVKELNKRKRKSS